MYLCTSVRTASTSLAPSRLRSFTEAIHASITGCVVLRQRAASSTEISLMTLPLRLETISSTAAPASSQVLPAMVAAAMPELASSTFFRSAGTLS